MHSHTATRSLLLSSLLASAFLVGCGSTLGSPDGGGAGGGAGARACLGDSDCEVSFIDRPVPSVAACYCLACDGTALNHATAESYRAQWETTCSQWSVAQQCPIYDCIAPPPVRCVGGLCTAGSQLPPTTCPQDPASGCADSAVRCGGACCKAGEWCDQPIGVCRCAYAEGCSGDLLCGVAGPITADSCGLVCCGGSSGQGCPR